MIEFIAREPTPKDVKYPCLMIATTSHNIWLMTSRRGGILMAKGHGNMSVGAVTDDMNPTGLTPWYGEIVIKQQRDS